MQILIAGAIVAYLLMALMWSLLYSVLEAAHPGAFKFPEGTTHPGQELFTYFSFVTITTVGYGSTSSRSRPSPGRLRTWRPLSANSTW